MVHAEFRESFLLHRGHDRLWEKFRTLGLFYDRVFLVYVFRQFLVRFHELNHLVRLPLVVGSFGDEKNAVGEFWTVELSLSEFCFETLHERINVCWQRWLRLELGELVL